MKLSELKPNPKNPRIIKDERFKKLCNSIKEFPKMMRLRPIVIDNDGMILGGNMRLRALGYLGYTEIPDDWVAKADDLTKEEIQRFIIVDNVGFGDNDIDMLANEFDLDDLDKWGLIMPVMEDDNFYTKDIKAPIYEPSEIKPELNEMVDTTKYDELIKEIEESQLKDEEKDFLKKAACRHLVFDYHKIADYYSNSKNDTKRLMENSALVIIDFDKAIENGYVRMINNIMDIQGDDYEE